MLRVVTKILILMFLFAALLYISAWIVSLGTDSRLFLHGWKAGLILVYFINSLVFFIPATVIFLSTKMFRVKKSISVLCFGIFTLSSQAYFAFGASSNIGLTRYMGHTPLFLDGQITASGLVLYGLECILLIAGYFSWLSWATFHDDDRRTV